MVLRKQFPGVKEKKTDNFGFNSSFVWTSWTVSGVSILTDWLTHQLNLWSWAPLERPPVVQPLDSFPAFHGTWRFITAYTRALQFYLSWARPIQSKPPNPSSMRSILMLSTHLHLHLPSSLFPSGFPTNNLHTLLFSPICAICPIHLILLHLIILIILGKEYKSCSSL
jgi:hypothetical protein